MNCLPADDSHDMSSLISQKLKKYVGNLSTNEILVGILMIDAGDQRRYNSAIGSLSNHAPCWLLSQLAVPNGILVGVLMMDAGDQRIIQLSGHCLATHPTVPFSVSFTKD